MSSLLNRRDIPTGVISLFDNTKTALFFYVFVRYWLKSQRHVRARGIKTTAKELYNWASQVSWNTLLEGYTQYAETFEASCVSFPKDAVNESKSYVGNGAGAVGH